MYRRSLTFLNSSWRRRYGNILIKPMTDEIPIYSFDKVYLLPRNLIIASRFLTNSFSGRFREQNSIDLNLDDDLKPAFEWIYKRWLEGTVQDGTEQQGRQYHLRWTYKVVAPPTGEFANTILLVDYLNMPAVLDDLRRFVIHGDISSDELIESYELIDGNQDALALKSAVIHQVVIQGRYFDELPIWAQDYLELQATGLDNLNNDSLFVARLFLPPDVPPEEDKSPYSDIDAASLYEDPGDARRLCPKERQSVLLDPLELSLLSEHDDRGEIGEYLIEGKIYYLACPNPLYPYVGTKRGYPCCYSTPQTSIIPADIDSLPTHMSPFLTGTGIVVYLPDDFEGDYVYTRNYSLVEGIPNAVRVAEPR